MRFNRLTQSLQLMFGVAALAAAAQAGAAGLNPADTSVQMFRWKWNDIARECTSWLGPQGYGAVQISPPHASRKITNAWYDIYQPVNYTKLDSLMGTEAELQAMINTCHAAGVRIYADVVVNHLAKDAGTASDGSTWNAAGLTYPYFSAADFHASCAIADTDYGSKDRNKVTTCRLDNLPDLNTGSSYVQLQIRQYLNKLVAMGIDGMRLDAAKHMAPGDISAFMTGVVRTTTSGEALWFTQEVINDGGASAADYVGNGTVNEFRYVYAMKEMFRNLNGYSVSSLPAITGTPANTWAGSWGMIPSDKATVFVNNWDTERHGPSSLVASNNVAGVENDSVNSRRYSLANVLMLAWPYGHTQVHSGFRFTNKDAGPPTASPFDAAGNALTGGPWDFIHRLPEVSNMVRFRSITAGQGVTLHAGYGNKNQIAFSRGTKGFVAINNDSAAWNVSLPTDLEPGTYCNVVNGQLNNARTDCSGDKVVVSAASTVTLNLGSVNGAKVPAVALHVDQRLAGAASCSSVAVTFRVANADTVQGQNLYLVGNRAEFGNWAPASAAALSIQGSGANAAWSRTVSLPPMTPIQYKFIKRGAGADVWEGNQGTGSGNREAVTPACGAATLVLDAGSFKS